MALIAVLPGDGIGPEVIAATRSVLERADELYGLKLELKEAVVGGGAIDSFGTPLPASALALCEEADAILLGAVGGPKWDNLAAAERPEAALLGLRKHFRLYANLRPVVLYPALANASPLRPELLSSGIDLLILRELTGGLYFGEPRGLEADRGYNTMVYSREEVERMARLAFAAARDRRKKVTSVDKANVLEVSQFWRRVVVEVAQEFPEVELEHLYVDNASMQLILRPGDFDVLVTENTFGDILSDEAGVITGSIGLLPSASVGEGSFGLYEPIHGSAPDIAGQDRANPLATILAGAMLLRHTLGAEAAARSIEDAVASVIAEGHRTGDLALAGESIVGTAEMGRLVRERLRA